MPEDSCTIKWRTDLTDGWTADWQYCLLLLWFYFVVQVLEYNIKLDQISKLVKTKRKKENYKKLIDSHNLIIN